MTYFRIARELGMPVSELLQRMSSTEIVEWAVLFEDEQAESTPGEGA